MNYDLNIPDRFKNDDGNRDGGLAKIERAMLKEIHAHHNRILEGRMLEIVLKHDAWPVILYQYNGIEPPGKDFHGGGLLDWFAIDVKFTPSSPGDPILQTVRNWYRYALTKEP